MKVLIAADKFKNSLTSFAVCEAVKKGFVTSSPIFSLFELPMSDGGDGLAAVMAHYIPSKKIDVVVSDPLFRPVQASFYLSDTKIAFVEMAQASGLHRLQPHEYNCLKTTTYGTGELLQAALEQGAQKIILGIGGSATNDGGMGMAQALGYQFLDKEGQVLKPIGENLVHIDRIDASNALKWKKEQVLVACDVTNYLTGPEGAAYVYGPQKGADASMIEQLEEGMQHFAKIVQRDLGFDLNNIKGGGAAGGLGAGCVAFINAQLRSGVDIVLQYSRADEYVQQADVVITGEGKIDEQTLNGKLIAGITQLGARYQKPVIAVCGTLALTTQQLKQLGLTAAFSILQKPMTLQEASENAFDLLTQTSFSIAQLLKCWSEEE